MSAFGFRRRVGRPRARVGGTLFGRSLPAPFATSFALLAACGSERVPPDPLPPEPGPEITSLEGLPGVECGTPLMVIVTKSGGSRFCIDRFEASVDGQDLGLPHQAGDDDTLDTLDGSTLAVAQVNLAVQPADTVSYYQAMAACQNAGKRLCSLEEWERACRGPGQLIYPYGDEVDETLCNGFYRYLGKKPTGSLSTCGSPYGVYDLSGNLEEWVDHAVERVPGSAIFNDRVTRGGSFRGNANALACTGPEFHSAPGSTEDDRGFRCCTDVPPEL